MALDFLVTDFLENLEFEQLASKLTIRNYSHYLRRFLSLAGDIDPKEIDLNLVRKYRLFLSCWTDPKTQKPLKKTTQNYFLIALRAFLKYLAGINIKTLSAEEVELEEAKSQPFEVLDENQLKMLLKAPDATKNGLRDRAILETLFSTGLRVSELASLNRDTINAPEFLDKYLSARKDTFKPLFIRFQGRVDPSSEGEAMRLTPRSIQRIVEKYVKKVGIPVKATPHTLRLSSRFVTLN